MEKDERTEYWGELVDWHFKLMPSKASGYAKSLAEVNRKRYSSAISWAKYYYATIYGIELDDDLDVDSRKLKSSKLLDRAAIAEIAFNNGELDYANRILKAGLDVRDVDSQLVAAMVYVEQCNLPALLDLGLDSSLATGTGKYHENLIKAKTALAIGEVKVAVRYAKAALAVGRTSYAAGIAAAAMIGDGKIKEARRWLDLYMKSFDFQKIEIENLKINSEQHRSLNRFLASKFSCAS